MAQVDLLSVLFQGCMGFSGGSPQASGSIARVARCKGGAPSPGRLPEDDVRPAVPVAELDCAAARTRLRVPGTSPARVSSSATRSVCVVSVEAGHASRTLEAVTVFSNNRSCGEETIVAAVRRGRLPDDHVRPAAPVAEHVCAAARTRLHASARHV